MKRSTVRVAFLAIVVLVAVSGCFEFVTGDGNGDAPDDGEMDDAETEPGDAEDETDRSDQNEPGEAPTEPEVDRSDPNETAEATPEPGTDADNETEDAAPETGTDDNETAPVDPEAAPLERAEAENVTAATFHDPAAETTVSLEIAATEEDQRIGLMNRPSLPERHGMVFVYSGEDHRDFWMKNTYVPLDIIFLDENRTVLNVEHADPQPNASDDDLAAYRSDGMAQYVIELEQGFANETSVEPGVEVEFHEDLEAAE